MNQASRNRQPLEGWISVDTQPSEEQRVEVLIVWTDGRLIFGHATYRLFKDGSYWGEKCGSYWGEKNMLDTPSYWRPAEGQPPNPQL